MSAQPTTPHLVKLDVCLYKKDDISHDDFIKWLREDYNAKALPILQEHGVVKWAQTATPPCFREPFRQALVNQMERPLWTVPDYDIVISYWLNNLEDMQGVTQDPRWIELEKEASERANLTLGHFVIGHQTVLFGE
ncbi:hypothetical protein QBC44DRAFT_346713 [Cladorrhinum sp. PSN332]|nr:hypothetical protein QBC44DRAFT_346713 [Cladorrhinum sp. PSN332]